MKKSERQSRSSQKKIIPNFEEVDEETVIGVGVGVGVANNNINLSNKKSFTSKLELLKKYEDSLKAADDEKEVEVLDESVELEVGEKKNKPQPKDFEKVWNLVQEMRDSAIAPVDTMGAEFCSDPKADRPTYKFQSLISLLLSSQTKDPITFAVMEKLIKHGLTIDNIIATEEDTIKEMIYGVSFHNNKSKFIKKLAQVLKDDYNSDAPEELKDLLKLPGIGPKMAHIYLQFCCGKIEGIAVDTHVHRISNRLKWVTETKTPEHTRKELESWLSKEKWSEINLLLVGFGQTICSAVAPKCLECKLNKRCEFGIERLKKLKEKKTKSKSKSKSKERVIEKPTENKTPSKLKRKDSTPEKSITMSNKKGKNK